MIQFIKLLTGERKFDNSMSRNTPRFWPDEYPLEIRPHLVESMRPVKHGDTMLTELIISGYEYAVYCLNTPDDIKQQIGEIENANT